MFDRKYLDRADNGYSVCVKKSASGAYNVMVDGEFWATAESMAEAEEEVAGVVKALGLRDRVIA